MKISIGVLAVIGLLAVGLNLLLPYIIDCQSVLIRSVQSPDAAFIASISSTTCDDPINSGTSVYIQDNATGQIHGTLAFDNSSTDFELTWTSDRVVTVIYPRSVELIAKSRKVNDVDIRFQQR